MPLTCRLLSHTAGLTVHGFPGYAAGEPLPTVPQILNGEKPANTPAVRVNKVPGHGFRYSGGGTTIVQLLMTDVTGSNFADLMREVVLTPLDMKASTFAQPLPQELADRAATAHDDRGHPVTGHWHIYPEQAPAGLWTTPSDMCRYMIDVQQAHEGIIAPSPQDSQLLDRDAHAARGRPRGARTIPCREGRSSGSSMVAATRAFAATSSPFSIVGRGPSS